MPYAILQALESLPSPVLTTASFPLLKAVLAHFAVVMANAGQERELVAHLHAIELSGIREPKFNHPVHTFVTISVDGDQQLDSGVSVNTLTPTWSFSPPLTLMVRASSLIKFTVYRQHQILSKVGNNNHHCGDVEMELQAVLVNPYQLHKLTPRWYSREDNLQISVELRLEPTFRRDGLLLYAEDRLRSNDINRGLRRSTNAMSYIGFAVEHLDQVVNIVDGVAEIHPLCKVAWTVLSSVYKAFKDEHALDKFTEELAAELKDTLACAKECRDLEAIPGATDVIHEIAKLVVESAAVFDAYMKHNAVVRAATGAATKTNHKRITECDARLKALRKKLTDTLTIRIWQGQNRLLEYGGVTANTSRISLPYASDRASVQHMLYTPPAGTFRNGYSPIYISDPEETYESKTVSRSPQFVSPYDDCIRCFTASPDLLDPSPRSSRSSSQNHGQFTPLRPDNTRSLPSFPSWPISSRVPSYASLTTDSGRTLSSRSSCSSLSEAACDRSDSHPIIAGQDAALQAEEDNCDDGMQCCSAQKSLSACAQIPGKPPRIAMPVPMRWSQIHL